MKFSCNGSDLASALSKVSKAISQKKNIPILEGVKISADNDVITLTATDTEMTIINKINGTVILAGDVVIDGKLMCELINKMAGQTVELDSIDGKHLNIKYLDSVSSINCMNLEEYPFIKELEGESIFIKKNIFKKVIDKISFSASNNESRPVLKGCLLKIKGDKLQGVALDGYRLAIATIKLDKEYDEMQAIVPAKVLFDMTRLIDNTDDYAKVIITTKKIMIDIEHTKIISSLIEGDFIKYDHIIPKSFNTRVIAIREQLDEVIGRVSIFSKRDKSGLITMAVDDKVMTLKSTTPQGNIIEKAPISMEGKDITIGLNSIYLNDCIKAIEDEQIRFNIVSASDPCTITPIDGDEFLYLILPIRIIE